MKFMRQAAPAVDSWVNSTWNPRAEVSLDKFLVPTMDDQGKKRLAVLGNVVVPPQASIGGRCALQFGGDGALQWLEQLTWLQIKVQI